MEDWREEEERGEEWNGKEMRIDDWRVREGLKPPSNNNPPHSPPLHIITFDHSDAAGRTETSLSLILSDNVY